MSLTPEQLAMIDADVRANQAVRAIKAYRDATGASLPVAIEFVDGRIRLLQSLTASSGKSTAAPQNRRRWRRSSTSIFILQPQPFAAEFHGLQKCVPASWWEELLDEYRTDPESNDEDFDVLDESPPEQQGGEVVLSQLHSGLLLGCCISRCTQAARSVESTDCFFADLESSPPDWRRLDPAASLAWETFLGVVDFSGRRNDQLPWWLSGIRESGAVIVGLLTPEEVKRVASNLAALKVMLDDYAAPAHFREDIIAMFDLIQEAASLGAWVLGREPQS